MKTQNDEKALASESESEPIAGGKDDGISDEIAGQNPGGFIDRSGERTGDIRKRHGGDGSVEHFHESGEHDRNGDKPGILARSLRILSGFLCHVPELCPGKIGFRGMRKRGSLSPKI